MMLITINEHPLRADAFDKLTAGMAIEAECRAAIHRADCAYRLSPPACAEYGIPCGHCTECKPGERAWPAVTPEHSQDRSYDGPTTMDRLQALHDHMDALNAHHAELRQAGRLKEPTTPVSDQALWLWGRLKPSLPSIA
jgi:hypothetical protein